MKAPPPDIRTSSENFSGGCFRKIGGAGIGQILGGVKSRLLFVAEGRLDELLADLGVDAETTF